MTGISKLGRRATRRPLTAALLGALALGAASSPAAALVPFDVRFESEKPGMQTTTATFSVGGVETFDSRTTGNAKSFTTDFGTNGAITGKYSNVDIKSQDKYGAAGGTGKYAVTFSKTGYTLDLSTTAPGGVNYFGYWLSALDRGNAVTFYRAGKELFTFNPQDVLDGLAKTGVASSYYGNPNAPFKGQNSGEPYVFVNFFSDHGSFDSVHFFEDPKGGGYESDNHSVGQFLTKGTGTQVIISGVPDAPVWGMLILGFGLVGAGARRRSGTRQVLA